jgi:hypothetical protein
VRLWKTYLNYITLTNWKSAADHLSTFAELLGEFSGFLLLWMLYHKKNKCKFSNFLNLTITTHICFAIGYILSSYLYFCFSVTSKVCTLKMSRQILSLISIFLTIVPQICLTLDQQSELTKSSESAEPAMIKPYISDYKRISKEFLGHLFPFQSWFLTSRLQRPAGYARPAYIKVNNFQKYLLFTILKYWFSKKSTQVWKKFPVDLTFTY